MTMTKELKYNGLTLHINNRGQIYNENGEEIEQRSLKNGKTGYANPYLYVSLYCGGRSRLVQVSRLVCMAFHPIDNPEMY